VPTLYRDRVALAFDEAGVGEPTIVLVHGWGANRSYMAPQCAYFRPRHRIINVDLRGHGDSGKPAQPYTIDGFADDVAWVCKQLDVERPILLGHSMGGSVVLHLAGSHVWLRPAGVVILEALVVAPAVLVDQFRPVLEGLRSPAYPQIMREFMDRLFGPHFDAAEKVVRLDQMAANPQQAMVSALESTLSHDSERAARACGAPVMYVSSGPWYTDVPRFRELCPQLVTGQIVGAGHYFELEVPEQVNPMIDRFLKVYTRQPQ
jgi:pimeloyl-ACP methyl ester carboxylesterase